MIKDAKTAIVAATVVLAAWFLYARYETWNNARLVAQYDRESSECKFAWENFRVLRQATTPYVNSATQSGFTVVYYEQVVGAQRRKNIALYRGPQKALDTCTDKRRTQYSGPVTLSDTDPPYALLISEGTVSVLYTRNPQRARVLEQLPIIGGDGRHYYVEDQEAKR